MNRIKLVTTRFWNSIPEAVIQLRHILFLSFSNREDQANEYTSLKKELEQTTKNCRILSFKLRKTERKTEQLEVEKGETEKKLREVLFH